MPCGSFKDKNQAESLKARIGLAGYSSSIKRSEVKGTVWHKVELGPFSRKRKAEKVRHRLQENDIVGCIIYRHIKKEAKKD
jgi:cell division protein FtsN